MKLNILTLAAAAAFLAAPALADDQAAVPAAPATMPVPAATTDDKSANKLICRKSTDTGTRLKARRVCYTREQWTTINREARESLKQGRTAGGN